MEKPSFKLRKDWIIETDILGIKNKSLIFAEGHIITPTKNGEYHIMCGGWSEDTPHIGCRMILTEEEMRLANDNGIILFEIIEPKQEIKFTVNELNEDDELKVSSWRIQIDVKTSRKKLKEIESFIKEKIGEIL